MPDNHPPPVPPASIPPMSTVSTGSATCGGTRRARWASCTTSTPYASTMCATSPAASCGRDPRRGAALEGLAIADIGCGGGIFAESLGRARREVTGVDPAPNNIEVASRHAAKSGLDIDYRNTTAEALARQRRDIRHRHGAGSHRACRRAKSLCRDACAAGEAGRPPVSRDHRPHAEELCARHRRRRICAWAGCRAARTIMTNSCGRTNCPAGCALRACGKSIAPA